MQILLLAWYFGFTQNVPVKIFLLLLAIGYLLVAKDLSGLRFMGPESLNYHIIKNQLLIILFTTFITFIVFCVNT
jgi:hypothetical protein